VKFVRVFAIKGPYLVVISAQGDAVSEETGTKEVAADWATAEYRQLPA
jgi:hypothetical protein